MVPAAGLEPASACAKGLKAFVSANSTMRAVLLQNWCSGPELNRRHPALQTGALPTELPLRLVPCAGVEPAYQKALDFESSVSASSTSRAYLMLPLIRDALGKGNVNKLY